MNWKYCENLFNQEIRANTAKKLYRQQKAGKATKKLRYFRYVLPDLKKTSNQIGRRKFVFNAHGNQLFGLMMPSFPRLCD